jgi:hypothetical protein
VCKEAVTGPDSIRIRGNQVGGDLRWQRIERNGAASSGWRRHLCELCTPNPPTDSVTTGLLLSCVASQRFADITVAVQQISWQRITSLLSFLITVSYRNAQWSLVSCILSEYRIHPTLKHTVPGSQHTCIAVVTRRKRRKGFMVWCFIFFLYCLPLQVQTVFYV